MNPECRSDKHKNCDGTGLDPETDLFGDCPCTCHRPKYRFDHGIPVRIES